MIEESFGLADVVCIQAFGELRPKGGEKIEGLLRPALIDPQRGKVRRGAKLERVRALRSGHRQGLTEQRMR
ncbi:MAG: hypothetical protein WAJ91_05395, partial [Rhodoplanes sp.]